jgi:hypothetical protein
MIMSSRYLFAVGAFFLLAWPTTASAAVYTTSTEQTRLVFNASSQVEYTTKIQGRTWIGGATVSSVPVSFSGVSQWQGKFQDFRTGGGAKQVCTGTIELTEDLTRPSFSVTWKVTGGEACPAVGQTISLNLVDALPRPNANGDFTADRVNQWNGGTQDSSWIGWQVVSADGVLNCRTQPNGSIQRTYPKGQAIKALIDRSGGAMTTLKGAPWLKTTDNCFVRANSRFIQPNNAF